MKVHKNAAPVIVQADVVDRQLVPVGYGPDPLRQGLALHLPRVSMHNDVGARSDALDTRLDGIGYAMGTLERLVSVHVDRHVHKKYRSRAAHANLADSEHTIDPGGRLPEFLGKSVGRPVEAGLHGPAAEPAAHEKDDDRDTQGRHGIGAVEALRGCGNNILTEPDTDKAQHEGAR